MSTTTVPSSANYSRMHRASAGALAAGLILSMGIHLGVGIGASGYFSSLWRSTDSLSSPIEIEPGTMGAVLPPDPLRLGMEDASSASIHWLGVIEDPEVGEAAIAEVEQAQFTRRLGNAVETAAPEPSDVLVMQEPVVQESVPELVQEEQLVQEPVSQGTDSQEPVEVEEDKSAPPEAAPETVDLEVEPENSAPILIETQPELIVEPAKAEEREPEMVETILEPEPIGPSLVSVDPNEQSQEPIETETLPAQSARVPAQKPADAGKEGIVSDRESAASIIQRAIKVDAKTLNKPIVGKGLEITTVEPKFPASVRFTQLPKNPVLLIRFDATGRVSKVRFLTEGRRVFDTGAKVVDQPLLSAVYQWRAKGKEIEALVLDDPESFIEISMNIIFNKAQKSP